MDNRFADILAMNGFACGKIGWPLKHTKGHEKYKIQKGKPRITRINTDYPCGMEFCRKDGKNGKRF